MYKDLPVFILFFVCMVFPVDAASLHSPWTLNEGENLREGIFSCIKNNCVSISTDAEILYIPLEPQPVAALIGNRYGRLVRPENFPPGLNVELFITPQGTVRAMRNKPGTSVLPAGRFLPGWGHGASLSPDGQHYLLFNLASGLFLYSLSPDEPPLPLSSSYCPDAAWHKSGTKVAYTSGDNLFIYDLANRKNFMIPLDKVSDKFALIITGLAWNQDNQKLLYTSLEDYPNLGSDTFSITIIDDTGKSFAVKTVFNLGTVTWLKNGLVFYVAFDSFEQSAGTGFIWDFRTGLTWTLLPEKKGGYYNICYNSELDILAYTVAGEVGEEIYIIDTSRGLPQRVLSYPLPVRNLQWSGQNTLFFWDEMNNRIYELKDLGLSAPPVARANGYLPPAAVADKLIYFLAEPLEEPQQPYLLD